MITPIPQPFIPIDFCGFAFGEILDVYVWMRALVYPKLGSTTWVIWIILKRPSLMVKQPRDDHILKPARHRSSEGDEV